MPVPNFRDWWNGFISPKPNTQPAKPKPKTTSVKYRGPGNSSQLSQRQGVIPRPTQQSKPPAQPKPTAQTKPTSTPTSTTGGTAPTGGSGGLHETKRDGGSLLIRYRNVNTGAWGGWVKVKSKKAGLPDRPARVKEARPKADWDPPVSIPTPVPPRSSIPTPVKRPEDRSKNRNKSSS